MSENTFLCPACGLEFFDPDHDAHCDGRQGGVELDDDELVVAPMVRDTDPDTSHAAAASWSADDLTEVQARVLALHQQHSNGLTDEELLHLYMREHVTAESSPRKRRCDLRRMGVLVDSGERRRLVSGRLGIVWKLAVVLAVAS